MSHTYTATGINLKTMPLGETDRLITILTREHGLVQAVAPGARKTKSSLAGRSGLFVVNHLFLVRGRSLDKITQAETLESYPGLAQDLRKLTTAQYLAELVLCQALSDQPQEELFNLFMAYLSQLEVLPNQKTAPDAALQVLVLLTHAAFHFLILAGIAPRVQVCCVTRSAAIPNFTDPRWRIGFSMAAGGVVTLSNQSSAASTIPIVSHPMVSESVSPLYADYTVEQASDFTQADAQAEVQSASSTVRIDFRLRAEELAILQRLAETGPLQLDEIRLVDGKEVLTPSGHAWLTIERVLRQYAQYQFDRPIRSSSLIDTCFSGVLPSSSSPPS